jgi:hypothetical protein
VLLGMFPASAGATTPQLTASPASLAFGWVVVGQTETFLVTLTNNGQTSVTVSGITVSSSQVTVSTSGQPLVLPAGQSVDLNVSYTPTEVEAVTKATVEFSNNASNAALVLPVWGVGETSRCVIASPSTVPFGPVAIGANSTVPVVLTNDRSWELTLRAARTTGSGFSVSGASFPLTLNAGQSLTLNVSFAPQSAGTVGGSLFVSDVGLTVPLTGTGTAGTGTAPVYTVNLNWTATTTTGVTNYNVYRANFTSGACSAFPIGSPYGSTASTVMTFTDPTVTNGNTYCYATTAVDPSGESGVSNVVQMTIP